MAISYWHKQTAEKPLFPEILWSRPETKRGAGKLAVIGGNAHGFGAPGIAWNAANEGGAGTVRVLLPDAIRKTVRQMLPEAGFAPSNPSGGFSRKALADCLDLAGWSDAVLLAGDFGRNSETAILLEDFIGKYTGRLTITQDAFDYFKTTPRLLTERVDTLLVISLSQLQKLFINLPSIRPITYSMSELQLVEALHELTSESPVCIVVKHHDVVFAAADSEVVSSELADKVWRVRTAARTSVFWLQNPGKRFEAITSALI